MSGNDLTALRAMPGQAADATPRVWDNIVDVPNNIRVTDRYRVEWRWDGAWEWLSVITGDWIIAGFSERREFAPFTEVL